ncbi:MAG TPA: TetR/AcrR family transcriptional regulator [Tabrizicola sp.]|nr:TetR/AcrR family transcriptional regulator [Tabrizicola sp.]
MAKTPDPARRLIEAGLDILAEDGIAGFVEDRLCLRAGVAPSALAGHFGSKDALLAAVYETAYQPMLGILSPSAGPLGLWPLIERIFDVESLDQRTFRIWLALWGEMAVNPTLMMAHRRNYWHYRAVVEGAIAAHCRAKGLRLDPAALAASVIGLVDGLWLEQCIDPDGFTPARARAACLGLLEPVLGPLDA